MTAIRNQVTLFSGGVFRLTIAKIVDTYKEPNDYPTDSNEEQSKQKEAAKVL